MRRRIAAVAGGIAAAGLTVAAAATLGGLTPDTIGASSTIVSSCQSAGLAIAWSAVGYSSVGPAETVAGGSITGVAPACQGLSYKLAVADSAGTALAEASGSTAAAATTPFTLTAAVRAEDVTQTTLVIYG